MRRREGRERKEKRRRSGARFNAINNDLGVVNTGKEGKSEGNTEWELARDCRSARQREYIDTDIGIILMTRFCD